MKQLRFYFLASLILHLLFLLFSRLPDFRSHSLELAQPIWIDLKKTKYEVADILPPVREERPEEAKFLGMYDSKTPEEKVAPTMLPKREERERKTENGKRRTENGERKMENGKWRTENGERKTDFGSLTQPSLSEDYFPDFRHGQHTYLNVLRFPDIQYFVMLKKVFKTTFNPISPLREAYFQNRITMGKVETVLAVSIDPAGNLAELFVLRGSGIEEYDQEALRTIRASAPFSKPPSKLLEGDNLVRMSWTFTVYL